MQNKVNPTRIGIIGCGRIAQHRHLPVLSKLKDVRITALTDTDSHQLSLLGERYRVDRLHTDHRAMLNEEAIDAVLVCTPPADHFAHARDVLESKRHLFVEAPLALNVTDCASLVELAARTNRVATVGLNLRYHTLIQRARRCVQQGCLGPVQGITATYSTPSRGKRQDVFPAWRQPDSVAGSVFMEGAIHLFDAWRHITGADIDEISTQCAFAGGPAAMRATMRVPEGSDAADPIVIGAVFSEYASDNCEILLTGRGGSLALSLYRFNGFDYCPSLQNHGSLRQHLRSLAESARSLPQGLHSLYQGGEYSRTFQRQLLAFVRAVRGGQAPLVSLQDGQACAIAALAAVQSANARRNIRSSSL